MTLFNSTNNLSYFIWFLVPELQVYFKEKGYVYILQMEEIEYSCEKCSGKAATVSHKFSKLPRY